MVSAGNVIGNDVKVVMDDGELHRSKFRMN